MKKILLRYTGIGLTILILLSITAILVCNHIVKQASQTETYSSTETIPYNKVGLLLGTIPVLNNGNPNPYFQYRIEAAVRLYQNGKIKYILVSGDNHKNDYNEPEEMRKALLNAGIPESAIIMDYAGLRTLDSIIRANKIFGQKSFTVISQQFHNERAIYIAHKHGLQVIGFNAQDVNAIAGFKTQVREGLARVKAVIDIITNKQPKHLGESIFIEDDMSY